MTSRIKMQELFENQNILILKKSRASSSYDPIIEFIREHSKVGHVDCIERGPKESVLELNRRVWELLNGKYGVFLVLGFHFLNPDIFIEFRNKVSFIRYETDDAWLFEHYSRWYAQFFHLNITTNKFCYFKFLELGYGAAYTPGIFRDHEPRSEEFRYDVSFVGIVSGKVGRGEYIRYLRDNGINVHVFGADAQYLTEDEKYAVYKTSKINLSFTYLDEFPELEKDEPDLIRKDNFKGRVFEIISVGAFCLTETSKESALIFDGSSPLAEFRGKEELLESVRFLLSDEKERATISKRCKMIFDSQFSETVVKRKLFSDIQKHFLNPDYPVSKVIWNKKAMRFLESYISGRVLLQIIFRERSYLRWFSLLSYVRRKLKM